ncbi:hypothetical protein [Microbacterium murale]|uniref:hypothetical protein n=1 Tax=Microbacterium murale TaxID=1081040 RepID=UPI0027D917EF|nr:hypothetical protein [Microbacterium murale]
MAKNIFFGIAVVLAAGFLWASFSGALAPSGTGKYAVEQECIQIVADWAGVDTDQLTSASVGTSKVALDYRGEYPGGEWACGGEINVAKPYQVMVYPGGADSSGIPEQIYSR